MKNYIILLLVLLSSTACSSKHGQNQSAPNSVENITAAHTVSYTSKKGLPIELSPIEKMSWDSTNEPSLGDSNKLAYVHPSYLGSDHRVIISFASNFFGILDNDGRVKIYDTQNYEHQNNSIAATLFGSYMRIQTLDSSLKNISGTYYLDLLPHRGGNEFLSITSVFYNDEGKLFFTGQTTILDKLDLPNKNIFVNSKRPISSVYEIVFKENSNLLGYNRINLLPNTFSSMKIIDGNAYGFKIVNNNLLVTKLDAVNFHEIKSTSIPLGSSGNEFINNIIEGKDGKIFVIVDWLHNSQNIYGVVRLDHELNQLQSYAHESINFQVGGLENILPDETVTQVNDVITTENHIVLSIESKNNDHIKNSIVFLDKNTGLLDNKISNNGVKTISDAKHIKLSSSDKHIYAVYTKNNIRELKVLDHSGKALTIQNQKEFNILRNSNNEYVFQLLSNDNELIELVTNSNDYRDISYYSIKI